VLLQSHPGSQLKPTILVSKSLENLCMELKLLPEEKCRTHYGKEVLQCRYHVGLINSLDKHCCVCVFFHFIDCIKIGLKRHLLPNKLSRTENYCPCTT